MNENWQEKLENSNMPKIELASHRQSLRRALLNSPHFQAKPDIFWVKRWAPLGAALVLVIFFTSQVIYAKVQESRAMEIARNDSEIQKLDLDFTMVKMAAKPTRLPSPEPSALISVLASPAVSSLATSSPSATPAVKPAKPAKKDKMISVEINDGKSKYTVFVNMTQKKVERVKKDDDKNKERNQATSTQSVGQPSQDEDKPESRLNERWQTLRASPTPISPARKEGDKKRD